MFTLDFLPELFWEQTSHQYDTIIVEWERIQTKSQNIIFVDQNSRHSLDAIVHHYTRQWENVLVVLGKTSVNPILFAAQEATNITIINPTAWLCAFSVRGKLDFADISEAMIYGFEVYDPYCIENFMEKISHVWGKKYIRINSHLLSADQYPSLKSETKESDVYSLRWLWFSGSHGTIIALWSSILDVFHTSTLLQEKWKLMDCFVCTRSDIVFCESLITSIRETEHLWIIADQYHNHLWEQNIKAKLWDLWLFETDLEIISPRLNTVTSFLDEYIYEQSEMDGPGIAARILG